MTVCLAESRVVACETCHGDNILTEAGAEFAQATLCSHFRTCPTCRGSGFRRRRDDEGYEVMGPCAQAKIARRVKLYNEAALPARFHDAKLGAFKARGGHDNNQLAVRKAVEDLRDRLIDAHRLDGTVTPGVRGLGLSGDSGRGKTHLLCALARELTIDQGISVRYADFSSLLWSLKSRFEAGAGEGALLQPLIETDVLILDEVGKGKASDWDISIVDALVAGRYNRRKTIVFATNYPFGEEKSVTNWGKARDTVSDPNAVRKLEALRQRVQDRVYSRLVEMCDLVTVVGPDYRAAARSPA